MKKNMGLIDRGIRIIIAVIFAILFVTGVVASTFGIILLLIGGIFITTSVVSFCPFYALIGINTCSIKK